MSCNVYADTGYSDPEGMQDKARIVRAMRKAIDRRELSLADASKLVGIPGSRLQDILRGGFRDVEPELLLGCLRKLGYQVHVSIRPLELTVPGQLRLLGGPPLL